MQRTSVQQKAHIMPLCSLYVISFPNYPLDCAASCWVCGAHAHLIIDLDFALELCISHWVIQHLPGCILHTSQGDDLGLQVL